MQEVKVVKLITGEEVIGRVVETINSKDGITLERVAVVVPQQTQDGQMGVALAPYIFTNPDIEIHIRSHAMVTDPFDAHPGLVKNYLQQTSGIALA